MRDRAILVRLTRDEKRVLQQSAVAEGVGVSTLLRQAGLARAAQRGAGGRFMVSAAKSSSSKKRGAK